MKTEQEIRQMIEGLESDLNNYKNFHMECLEASRNNRAFYSGSWKNSIEIAKAQIFTLKMVLEEVDF